MATSNKPHCAPTVSDDGYDHPLTIYKASAGSGKTFTLAYEYIKALLTAKTIDGHERAVYRLRKPEEANAHRRILAITFTNKATEEMKTRIVEALSEVAQTAATSQPSQYCQWLMQLTGCNGQDLGQVAARALENLLYDFHFFNVSTIDSFFQLVLRTFAREIDRPEDFDIELNDEYVIAMAIDQMYDTLAQYPDDRRTQMLKKWLLDYMEEKMINGENYNIFNREGELNKSLIKFVKHSISEVFKFSSKSITDYLSDLTVPHDAPGDTYGESSLKRYSNALAQRIRELDNQLRQALEAVQKVTADYGSDFEEKVSSYVRNNIRAFASIDTETAKKAFDNVMCQKTGYVKDALSDPATIFLTAHRANPNTVLANGIQTFYRNVITIGTEITYLKEIRRNLGSLGMLGFVFKAIDAFRRENKLILLSDTNELLSKVIGDDDTPFVYERMGVNLRNFLIDEFQDTSGLQWQNLRPLVENGLSMRGDSLIIGDEKQSIYRFRNADYKLLHHKVIDEMPAPMCQVKGLCPEQNTNWRSAPTIIRFNNRLFRVLSAQSDVDIYQNVTQSISPKKRDLDGHVQVKFAPASASVLPELVKVVRKWRENGFRWNEMAILARTNNDLVKIVTYFLEECDDIPISSPESLTLDSCHSIKVVISLLRMIETSRLKSEKSMSKNELAMRIGEVEYQYSSNIDKGLSEAVRSVSTTEFRPLEIVSNIESKYPTNLITLIEYVIDEALTPEARSRDAAFILAFQDKVADFCNRNISNLHTFINWWDKNKDSLTIPSANAQDALTLMTVHKSKGLEFACVAVPFAGWRFSNAYQQVWWQGRALPNIDVDVKDIPPLLLVNPSRKTFATARAPFDEEYCNPFKADYDEYCREQLLDNFNMAYVAYTRAGRELAIFTTTPSKDKKDEDNEASTMAPLLHNALHKAYLNELPLIDDLEMDITANCQTLTPDDEQVFVEQIEIGQYIDRNAELAVQACREQACDEAFELTGCYKSQFDTVVTANLVNAELSESDDASKDDEPALADTFVEDIDDDDEIEGQELTKRQLGELMHQALSLVTEMGSITKAAKMVAHRNNVGDDVADQLAAMVEETIDYDDPLVQCWFKDYDYVLAERPIYTRNTLRRTWRPDRIVWLPDGQIHVVDFKFGNPKARFQGKMVLKQYQEQVREYIGLIKQMYPDTEVTGYIYYPLSKTIKKVDD